MLLSIIFDGYKKELSVLGTVSGRDQDKINHVHFHTTYIDDVPTFEEAHLVFIVEKSMKMTLNLKTLKIHL